MLPAETQKVWNWMRQQRALAGFVLIGGSALALRIGHRVSEDLDFAWLGDSLPRREIEALTREATRHQFDFRHNDDPAALDEFTQGGLELRDYQQDFLVNRVVKVSFFTGSEALLKVLAPGSRSGPRIAELAELFKSKAVISAARSKTRDWLDLFLLMTRHGFTIENFREAFVQAGIEPDLENALARLCSGSPSRTDEGYAHLLANAPRLEQMQQYFVERRDELERRIAADAARKRFGS